MLFRGISQRPFVEPLRNARLLNVFNFQTHSENCNFYCRFMISVISTIDWGEKDKKKSSDGVDSCQSFLKFKFKLIIIIIPTLPTRRKRAQRKPRPTGKPPPPPPTAIHGGTVRRVQPQKRKSRLARCRPPRRAVARASWSGGCCAASYQRWSGKRNCFFHGPAM